LYPKEVQVFEGRFCGYKDFVPVAFVFLKSPENKYFRNTNKIHLNGHNFYYSFYGDTFVLFFHYK